MIFSLFTKTTDCLSHCLSPYPVWLLRTLGWYALLKSSSPISLNQRPTCCGVTLLLLSNISEKPICVTGCSWWAFISLVLALTFGFPTKFIPLDKCSFIPSDSLPIFTSKFHCLQIAFSSFVPVQMSRLQFHSLAVHQHCATPESRFVSSSVSWFQAWITLTNGSFSHWTRFSFQKLIWAFPEDTFQNTSFLLVEFCSCGTPFPA